MKIALIFIFLLHMSSVKAAYNNLPELRTLYYKATVDKVSANLFLQIMDNVSSMDSPIMLCYKAMSYLLLANHSINPYTKWSYFKKGQSLLDAAVKAAPLNVEIRFMRFCTQTNVPLFLGYHKNINNDKTFVLNLWNKVTDPDLKNRIQSYLLASGHCGKEDSTILQ